MEHPGYIWTVYPNDSALPMVSLGQTDDLEKAMGHVEGELGRADHAGLGIVIGPGGMHHQCKRKRGGAGYHWAPLFSEAGPALPSSQP